MEIVIWADGGSRGNPGPAAVGAVIQIPDKKTKTYAEFAGQATNNIAEYKAVVLALKKVKHLIGSKEAKETTLRFKLDSELVARQLQGKYKILEKELQPFFIEVWNKMQDFGKVIFENIPREQNKQADKLVNEVLDKEMSKQGLFK